MVLNSRAIRHQTSGDTACRPSGLYALRAPGLQSRPNGSNPYRVGLKGECATRGLRMACTQSAHTPAACVGSPKPTPLLAQRRNPAALRGLPLTPSKREVCDLSGGLPPLPSCRPGDTPPPDRACPRYPRFRQRAGLHAICKPNPKGIPSGKPNNRNTRPEPGRR